MKNNKVVNKLLLLSILALLVIPINVKAATYLQCFQYRLESDIEKKKISSNDEACEIAQHYYNIDVTAVCSNNSNPNNCLSDGDEYKKKQYESFLSSKGYDCTINIKASKESRSTYKGYSCPEPKEECGEEKEAIENAIDNIGACYGKYKSDKTKCIECVESEKKAYEAAKTNLKKCAGDEKYEYMMNTSPNYNTRYTNKASVCKNIGRDDDPTDPTPTPNPGGGGDEPGDGDDPGEGGGGTTPSKEKTPKTYCYELEYGDSPCSEPRIKLAVSVVGKVIDILKIVGPILLVIFAMIDIVKAVLAGDDSKMEKAKGIMVKRVISAVIIFFVVTIIQLVCNLIGDGAVDESCFEVLGSPWTTSTEVWDTENKCSKETKTSDEEEPETETETE